MTGDEGRSEGVYIPNNESLIVDIEDQLNDLNDTAEEILDDTNSIDETNDNIHQEQLLQGEVQDNQFHEQLFSRTLLQEIITNQKIMIQHFELINGEKIKEEDLI